MAKCQHHRATKKKRLYIWFTLVACFLECFFFAGSIFGWPSLAYMLQQDGIFIQQCPNDTAKVNGTTDLDLKDNTTKVTQQVTDTGCDAQRSSIALAFTFSTIILGLMTFPNGMIFDKYGLRVTRCLATGVATSGHLMLAFAAPNRMSYLIYPGSVFVGISCSVNIMITFHICLLAGSSSSTMSALYAGAVNSGAAVFLIIKLLYGYGFPRRYGLLCLCGMYIYSLAITFFLLPKKKVYSKMDSKEMIGKTPDAEEKELQKDLSSKDNEHDLKENADSKLVETQLLEQNPSKMSDMRQILTSSYYLLHVYWFAMVHLRVTFFCSSFNSWAEHLTGNDEEVSQLTNNYGYIQMCSVLMCPVAGLLVDYFRRKILKEQGQTAPGVIHKDLARAAVLPIILSSLSAASLCICTLLRSKNAVWAGSFLVELTRAFLYVTMGTYTSLTFPAGRFGVLFGIVYAAGGLTTGLQYGLLQWSLAWKDFFYPNLVLMMAILLTFAHPANIYIRHLWSKRSHSL